MSRVLAYTSPARGHLYPIVATLIELRQRGHEVHVVTLGCEAASLTAVGLRPHPLARAIEERPLDDWDAPSPQEGLSKALATFAQRAPTESADLLSAIDTVQPDVLLVDIMTIGASAVAESTGLPWAQWIPLFQHASVDGSGASAITRVPFSLHPAGLDVLNAPRHELGLRPLLGGPDVWRAAVNLYLTAPPFEAPGLELPPSFRVVGPSSWEPPTTEPAWLADCPGPVTLVTASTEYQSDRVLIETALDALADQPGTVVATTAAHDPKTFAVPDNAYVGRRLPHQHILTRADVVLCHGGMGITQKALAAGVPVCVVPFGRDQFEVASRVADASAGVVLPPDRLTTSDLRRALSDAVTMRPGAQIVAAAFAAHGGATAAADAVEGLVSVDANERT